MSYKMVKGFLFLAATSVFCARAEWANPELVDKVVKGEVSEARVSWWGFDKDDSTRFLQAAIKSGVKKLVVDKQQSAWVSLPLFAVSNQHIVFEPGVMLLAKRGAFKGRNDRLLSVDEVQNVKITGYGATLRMWREDYAKGAGYRRGEWRHALSVSGSRNVIVEGLTLEDSGGDGIYISTAGVENSSRDIVIRDCVCNRNHRQGVSVIAAKNLLIENCVFKNTRGTAPQDGIDFEPNNDGESFENCVVRNCLSENNAGFGFELAMAHSRAATPPCSILFENCKSVGDKCGVKVRTRVKVSEGDYPTGNITFRNCAFEKTQYNAVEIQQNPENGLKLSFDKCSFGEIGCVDPAVPLVVLHSFYVDDPIPAMPDFIDMSWPDRSGRALNVYDIPDSASLQGRKSSALLLPSTEGAQVVDNVPGQFVECSPLKMRGHVRLVAYADSARKVTLRGRRAQVGQKKRKFKATTVPVLDADGRAVAKLPMPGYSETDMSFQAPSAGFYSFNMDFGPDAFVVIGTDAPLAVDCTRKGPKMTPPCFIWSSGNLYAPIKKGQTAEFRVRGSAPSEKVAFWLTDPDGKEIFRNDAILYWTLCNVSPEKNGVWKLSFGKPSNLNFEDFSVEVAGLRPFLFFSSDKYWYSE